MANVNQATGNTFAQDLFMLIEGSKGATDKAADLSKMAMEMTEMLMQTVMQALQQVIGPMIMGMLSST